MSFHFYCFLYVSMLEITCAKAITHKKKFTKNRIGKFLLMFKLFVLKILRKYGLYLTFGKLVFLANSNLQYYKKYHYQNLFFKYNNKNKNVKEMVGVSWFRTENLERSSWVDTVAPQIAQLKAKNSVRRLMLLWVDLTGKAKPRLLGLTPGEPSLCTTLKIKIYQTEFAKSWTSRPARFYGILRVMLKTKTYSVV